MPNERFISYPPAGPATPGGLLLGWAGWDDRERAQVLADLATEAMGEEGGEPGWVIPLLAGLHETLPWVVQWHDQPGRVRELTSGRTFEEFIARSLEQGGGSEDSLREWRPQPPKRGRPRKQNR